VPTANEVTTANGAYINTGTSSNALFNKAGRIESLDSVEIDTDKFYNVGVHKSGGYTTGYHGNRINENGAYNLQSWGWNGTADRQSYEAWKKERAYLASFGITEPIRGNDIITDVTWEHSQGYILGNNITVNAKNFLNSSSTVSAKQNLSIFTNSLRNEAASYDAPLNAYTGQGTESYTQKVYSRTQGLLLAGKELDIESGYVSNGQIDNILSDSPDGRVDVNINIPKGNNGLFVPSVDPKYLVQNNGLLDDADYVGAEYFFEQSGITDTLNRAIIGDAAYETRLVMDALRDATMKHHEDNNGNIGADMDIMKELYANTQDEAERLDLSLGVALTEDQIEKLTHDIIWYEEQDINGQKVLVPTLYLCEATRDAIDPDGSKIAGGTVNIDADYVDNSGDINASDLTVITDDYTSNGGSLDADNLTIFVENAVELANAAINANQHANITVGGDMSMDNASLTAGNVNINITGNLNLANSSSIDTDKRLDIITGGDVNIEGSSISAEDAKIDATGNVNIVNVDDIVGKETVVIGSNITIDKQLDIFSDGDITIRGSSVATGNAKIDADGDLNILEAYNHNESSETTKDGGLWGSGTTTTKTNTAVGSTINVTGKVELASGGDTTISGSNVSADYIDINTDGKLTVAAAKNTTDNVTTSGGRQTGEGHTSESVGSKLDAGNKITIHTGGDMDFMGTMEAEDAEINVGGDLNILAGYKTDNGNANNGNSVWDNSSVVQSKLDIGNSLKVTTGGDMSMTAADIIGKDISFDLGGDLNMLEAYNKTYTKTVTSSGSLFKKETTTTIDETSTSVGSTLDTGNFTLKTGGDATFRDATLKITEDALFNVGGNMNVEATRNYTYHDSRTQKSSFGGLVSENHTKIDRIETLAGSNVTVNKGLNIISGKNTNIIGSNITALGDMGIYTGYKLDEDTGDLTETGTGGSLNVLADYISETHFEETETTNMFKDFDVDISFNGGFSASVDIGQKTRDMTENTTTTAVSSTLNANNLTVVSSGDVNIKGSIIDTKKDLSVSAANDINITAAENSYNEREEHEETTISLTAKVGNAYVDAALAIKALADAAQAEKEAVRALEDIKKLWNDGKATSDAVYQAEANLAMATANLLQATINAATAAGNAAASGAGSFGTGIYVSAGLSLESTTEFLELDNKTYTGSTLTSGGNSIFNAGRNMNQIGSSVSSTGDVTYNIKGNLRLEAVKETSTTESGSTSANVSLGVGTNGVSVGGGMSSSSSKSGDSWYVNSSTSSGGTISYNVDGDMVGLGYNAIGTDVKGHIKGNLTLTSLQDNGTSSSNSASAGMSIGSNGMDANVGMSKGSGDYQQTNVSSIFGTGSVDLTVDGKLSLTGSSIANVSLDENGMPSEDKSNLNLSLGSFEYTDLKDYMENDQSGFRLGSGTSSTTVGITKTGQEREGYTYATIGNGNITIKDNSSMEGLNRNILNNQVTTTDRITGVLDGDVTLDHRWLSEDGRTEIANDLENFVGNSLYGAGKLWNSPNTALGFLYGGASMLLGDAELKYDENKDIAYFTNFNLDFSLFPAITIGEVILFADDNMPESDNPPYSHNVGSEPWQIPPKNKYGYNSKVILGEHEFKHVEQGRWLGPLYIPMYFLSGGASGTSWMDTQADHRGYDKHVEMLDGLHAESK
jgi:filamentous hemagglutinin